MFDDLLEFIRSELRMDNVNVDIVRPVPDLVVVHIVEPVITNEVAAILQQRLNLESEITSSHDRYLVTIGPKVPETWLGRQPVLVPLRLVPRDLLDALLVWRDQREQDTSDPAMLAVFGAWAKHINDENARRQAIGEPDFAWPGLASPFDAPIDAVVERRLRDAELERHRSVHPPTPVTCALCALLPQWRVVISPERPDHLRSTQVTIRLKLSSNDLNSTSVELRSDAYSIPFTVRDRVTLELAPGVERVEVLSCFVPANHYFTVVASGAVDVMVMHRMVRQL